MTNGRIPDKLRFAATRIVKASKQLPWPVKAVWLEDKILYQGPEGSYATAAVLGARIGLTAQQVERHRRSLSKLGMVVDLPGLGGFNAKGKRWYVDLPECCKPVPERISDEDLAKKAGALDQLILGLKRNSRPAPKDGSKRETRPAVEDRSKAEIDPPSKTGLEKLDLSSASSRPAFHGTADPPSTASDIKGLEDGVRTEEDGNNLDGSNTYPPTSERSSSHIRPLSEDGDDKSSKRGEDETEAEYNARFQTWLRDSEKRRKAS